MDDDNDGAVPVGPFKVAHYLPKGVRPGNVPERPLIRGRTEMLNRTRRFRKSISSGVQQDKLVLIATGTVARSST